MTAQSNTSLDFARDLDFSQILTNPILDIAARFWDDDRYQAFRVTYRSMRRIDDLVDNRKTEIGKLPIDDIRVIGREIDTWLSSVREEITDDVFTCEFLDVLKRFAIPLWPWERLGSAMVYDLQHDGFTSFRAFLRYTEGAAIAPASVFTHLCGVRPRDNGYQPPVYDIRKAARSLAVFSYLVHIIRDFQEDQLNRLTYFADDLLRAHHLTAGDLRKAAETGKADASLRALMRQYVGFAEYYRARARQTLDGLAPLLEPRYQLSLEVIYGLYLQIFECFDPDTGNFTTQETNPQPAQLQARIEDIITSFVPARQS
jgi:phytoene/squalene synthetase